MIWRYSIAKLLDAPCGDRNWIRSVNLPCEYVGVDHEPEHVRRASGQVEPITDEEAKCATRMRQAGKAR